jgi:hypothetical protein
MKSRMIIATVLAAALAVISISVPASAAGSNEKKQTVTGLGILPAVAGPAAIFAGLNGPAINTFTFTKYFKFKFWDVWGWKKTIYLHKAGWELDIDKCYRTKVCVHAEKKKHTFDGSNRGKLVVGCIMGSALGAITAAVRKGNALGNPLRWRSQAEHEAIVKSGYEKQFELTNDEAATAVAFCGAGSLMLHWQQKQAPAVVKARF